MQKFRSNIYIYIYNNANKDATHTVKLQNQSTVSQSPEGSLDIEPIFHQQQARFSPEFFRSAMNSHHSCQGQPHISIFVILFHQKSYFRLLP